jgi:hypothetical protein
LSVEAVLAKFKKAGFSGKAYRVDDIPIPRPASVPVHCEYKGILREVNPAVCRWHKVENDSECLKCSNPKVCFRHNYKEG